MRPKGKDSGIKKNVDVVNKASNFLKLGLSNYYIAKELGTSMTWVYELRKKLKLPRYRKTKKLPDRTLDGKIICKVCKIPKSENEFWKNSVKAEGIFHTCGNCIQRRANIRFNSNLASYLKSVISGAKARAKSTNQAFEIKSEDLLLIYNEQKEKCFYTDKTLLHIRGEGAKQEGLSIDKIEPSNGYIKENIVLCTKRANAIKNNMSIEEFKEWMPTWYERVRRKLAIVKSTECTGN